MTMLNWWLERFPRYEFLVEYYLFLIPMVIHLPRRQAFLLRLLPMISFSFLLSSQWNSTWAAMLPLYILRYLTLFGLGILITSFCFDCELLPALYCGAAAYAAQHVFNRVFDIAVILTGIEKGAGYNALYLFLFGAVFSGMLFVFTRRIHQDTVSHMANRKNLTVSGLILICTVVLLALWRREKNSTLPIQQVIVDLYDMAACISALVILFNIFRMDEMKHDAAVIREMWNQERKQLALSQETVQMLNLKCHDMRHLLRLISAQQDDSTQREIDSIRELIDVYDSRVDTGNEVLNLLLAEKGLLCQKEKIRLNCVADGQRLSFMEKPDIYSLFGNALDNAIEAVRLVESPDMRIITLTVVGAMGMTSVCVENYYQGDGLQVEDGLPVTTKEDHAYHGYGVKSMQYLVKKYKGELSIGTDHQIFSLKLLLPDPE
ncbi:MAG: sensor histidine kinase [Oscillospiraceae bacterium]|nr:sensor histidine kinase [Clostridia bacterium]MBR4550849.1 sensor histidine kinase [Oscillospiraceae bacterium]